jgi:hypothetical protein
MGQDTKVKDRETVKTLGRPELICLVFIFNKNFKRKVFLIEKDLQNNNIKKIFLHNYTRCLYFKLSGTTL